MLLSFSKVNLFSVSVWTLSEVNQGLIMSRGGAQLLAGTASKTNDPQTLRMVAGALANLCGNGNPQMILESFLEKNSKLHICACFEVQTFIFSCTQLLHY